MTSSTFLTNRSGRGLLPLGVVGVSREEKREVKEEEVGGGDDDAEEEEEEEKEEDGFFLLPQLPRSSLSSSNRFRCRFGPKEEEVVVVEEGGRRCDERPPEEGCGRPLLLPCPRRLREANQSSSPSSSSSTGMENVTLFLVVVG